MHALIVGIGRAWHEVKAALAGALPQLAHGVEDVVCLERQVLQPRALILLQKGLQSHMTAPAEARTTLHLKRLKSRQKEGKQSRRRGPEEAGSMPVFGTCAGCQRWAH